MDTLSPTERSALMARVRSKNTSPERLVRSVLHRGGLRFRLHVSSLPGTPDIVLAKHRAVVFVQGCFWHGHSRCRRARLPASRSEFWHQKITCNRKRDRKAQRALRTAGWRVYVLWTCKLDHATLEALTATIRAT